MNKKMAPTFFAEFNFSFEDNFDDFGTILADEFRKSRKLLPIKIIIDGPPNVGKTSLAKCLAAFYNLHYIDTENIVNIAINYLTNEIEDTKRTLDNLELERAMAAEAAADAPPEEDSTDVEDKLKEFVETWTTELEEIKTFKEALEAPPDEEGEEKEKPEGGEFELKRKCLMKMLSTKGLHENQGYVLDGFPFDYDQASQIIPSLATPTIDQVEEEEGEEEEAIVTDSGPAPPGRPDYVILLDASDELLCKRAMAMTEDVAAATKNTEQELLSRLQIFRDRNQEDKSLLSFFYDNNLIPMPFCITADTVCNEICDKIKEKIGPPHVYPISKAEKQAIKRMEEELRAKRERELKKLKEEAIVREREERETKLQKWTKEFERLKCKEEELIEAKTLPLQQYLARFVLPTLTDGLLKVAEVKPKDPVDFLAEQLFKKNPHGHVLNPSYSHEMKRLLLQEGDEDIAATLDMMAENESEFTCAKKVFKERRNDLSSDTTSSGSSEQNFEDPKVKQLLKEFGGVKS